MSAPTLQVLSVASEIFPLVKTGGLADVAGALPGALADEGVAMRCMMPGYPAVMRALGHAEEVLAYPDLFGGPARIRAGRAKGLELLVVDAPHLFDREGNPYVGSDGQDWPDNALRFAALGRAAADVGLGRLAAYRPDLVHAHDWQAGLAAAYLRHHEGDERRPGTIFTIHNIAFQGNFPAAILPRLGLPWEAFRAAGGLEFYDQVSFLKAGLAYSDRITTVSPTYAAEILTPEFGWGMEGVLRERAAALSGIRNGIDEAVWNPKTDELLAKTYSGAKLGGRTANKRALLERFGLATRPDRPLFGVVSRLSGQKGLDLLLGALDTLLDLDAQLVLLGSGERWMEDGFRAAAGRHPDRIGVRIGYDEGLAHLIQAGSDAILVPSRFEPCGLTQLCALRYGAVPVVARTGGLADTVVDANEMALAAGAATGIQFNPVTEIALRTALRRTVELYGDRPAWKSLVSAGMATDVSWRRPAGTTAELYRLVAPPTARTVAAAETHP